MTEVKIVIPGRDSPGYLRRQKKAIEYAERVKDKARNDPSLIDEMASFLAPIVVIGDMKPEDAKEWLMDNLTEAQFDQIMEALTGETGSVPPKNAESSSDSIS